MANRQAHRHVGISDSLEAVTGGIGFIVGTPSIWLYAAVPMVMALVLCTGFSALGIWGSLQLSDAVFGSSIGFWSTLGSWTLNILLIAVALMVAVVLGLSLAQPLSGFALEKIVHAQEHALTGTLAVKPGLLITSFISLKVTLFALVLGLPVVFVLFLIGFFFPPAAVVTVPLKFVVCSWMVAWDVFDYPLGIRALGIRGRLKWVFRHFGAFTVFGMIWLALAIIPGVILVLLPMGVAGATRLVVLTEGTD